MSTDPTANRGVQIIQSVVAQALADEEFRLKLLDDPRGVLRDAGLTVSEETEVVIHENTDDTVHFVLPSPPAAAQELDIDEVDIVLIAYHWPI